MINYYNISSKKFFKKNSISYFDGINKISILKEIPRFITSKISYAEMWGKQWSELDTHDALTDNYKRLLTKRSFSKMLDKLGGKIELLSSPRPRGNGLEARVKKI